MSGQKWQQKGRLHSLNRTLPTPTVEFPKAGALHKSIETLLLDQFQDLRLNLLF